MPTVKEIVTAVREYCGNPGHDKLNLGTICLHLYDQIDHLLNRLNITDENWIIGRTIVSVDGGNDEYTLPTEFGRPVFCETVDDGTSDFQRREVEIVNVQDFNLYWSGYKISGVYGSIAHSAEVVAVFGPNEQPGVKLIKFAPPPQQAADYRVWYDVARQTPPQLAEKPLVMEQFHNLLKIDTAISCLPHCGYGPDEFQPYMEMLQWNHERFDAIFERYIAMSHHEDTGPRRAFNSSRRTGVGWW